MTSYQEQAGLPAKDRKTSNLGYRQLVAELENKLQKDKSTLEQAESAYDAADEAVFDAESSAEENEKAYQASHELLQALLTEEESMRSATEIANSLATDASSLKTDKSTNYSDLLHQAMSALLTVSANAEEKLAEKRQQREKAQYQDQILHLEAATARLTAYTTKIRRAKTEYFRLHATNDLELTENRYKLAKIRRELTDILQQIKDDRKSLEENITAYYSSVEEAQQLIEKTKRHKEELAELNENLSATSTQIIPYETLVNDLEHDESNLQEAYNKATKEAAAAYQQQELLTKALEEAIQAEQEKEQSAKAQLDELQELNKELVQNGEQKLQDAEAAMNNAADLTEQAQRELAENTAQIPALEKELAASQEALEKAQRTAQETARMVANVQAVKFTMKENSTKVLSGAENVLQNTLEAANNMVIEKEAANIQVQRNLDETKEIQTFLQQAADETQQAFETLFQAYDAIQTEQNELLKKIQESEKQLKDVTERQLSEAKNHRIHIETELNSAEKFTAAQRKLAEELKQQLEEVQTKYKAAVESRDEMKKQIYEINTRIEVEKMQETSDRENRIITLWENSEKLQMRIRESGQQLQRNIENVHKLSTQEQRCIRVLERTLKQVNQNMEAFHKQRIISMDDYEAMAQELREALEDYRRNPIAMLQQSEYSATILAANLLLDNSETVNAECIQKPMYYELDIGDCTDIDSDLITAPIPQLDTEQTEKSQVTLETLEEAADEENAKNSENAKPQDEAANKEAAEITVSAKVVEEDAAVNVADSADALPPLSERKTIDEKQRQTKETIQDNREITDSPFDNIPLTSNNPYLLNQLLDLVSKSQTHNLPQTVTNQPATNQPVAAAPIAEIGIPEEATNNQLPAKDSTDLLAELMTLIGSNAAQTNDVPQATGSNAPEERNTAAMKTSTASAIEQKQSIKAPAPQNDSAEADRSPAVNSPATSAAMDSGVASMQNNIATMSEQVSLSEAQKGLTDAASRESLSKTAIPDMTVSATGDRLLELMNLVGSSGAEAATEPEEAIETYTAEQQAETISETEQAAPAAKETSEVPVAPIMKSIAAVDEATGVAAEAMYHENAAARPPAMSIANNGIEEAIAQEPVEESSEMAADFEYLGEDFSYIDNTGDDLAQLLEDIATLRDGMGTTIAVSDNAPAKLTPERPSISATPTVSQTISSTQSTSSATGAIDTASRNSERDIISNEISNPKPLPNDGEKEHLEKLDAAFKANQEEAARIESERLRKEEEAAQLEAEREAEARAIEEQKAAEEEAKRLIRLAEKASKQFEQRSEEQKEANKAISTATSSNNPRMDEDEDEDDLEAELRRIIFSDFR